MKPRANSRAVRLGWRTRCGLRLYDARALPNPQHQYRSQCTGANVPASLVIDGRSYPVDDWTNVPSSILNYLPRKVHQQTSHPVSITRQLIESTFPSSSFTHYKDLHPVVTVAQNFDSLGFPEDHPGRSRSDTYYINKDTVLRTHTSAHEVDIFRKNMTQGYTISADVYRRDAIDRSHYPVFHQMEGARMWDRRKALTGDVARAVWDEVSTIAKTNLEVQDSNPVIHSQRNPLQDKYHSKEEVEAMASHLKRTLEHVVVELFSRAHQRAAGSGDHVVANTERLRVRWVEAYFPFTSPSWELEVFWQGDWLEILGCGITKQEVLLKAGVESQLGWAFGVGLERLAMILFSIPDIRLFWSRDPRFLSQFTSKNEIRTYVPFSVHPACYKDVSFWLRGSNNSAGGGLRSNVQSFHENDFMEIVRDSGGDLIEDVKLFDEWVHPISGRKSLAYRINYRSLERTLRNAEADELHELIKKQLIEKLGVDLR